MLFSICSSSIKNLRSRISPPTQMKTLLAIYIFYDRDAPRKITKKYPLSANLDIFNPLAWFIVSGGNANFLALTSERVN